MKILFVNSNQFGYTAGYYHYCKYLILKGYDIDIICVDQDLPKIELEGVNVTYVKVKSNMINWRYYFYMYLSRVVYSNYNIIFLYHFKYAFIYWLSGIPNRAILDIRTGNLSDNRIKRYLHNILINFESRRYKHITILSETLRSELKIPEEKCTLLPLGAEVISSSNKLFDYPRLIYVGTFYKRNIPKTIKAVSLYKKKFPSIPIIYDIIGFGYGKEEADIKSMIQNENLQENVFLHGRKNYNELHPFFEKANIGIAYIPITDYFNCQPSTKIFEYSLSGLVCIATNTVENKKLLNDLNGLLCEDSPESLSNAIEIFYSRKNNFSSNEIRNTLLEYKWEKIVYRILEPLFDSIMKNILKQIV